MPAQRSSQAAVQADYRCPFDGCGKSFTTRSRLKRHTDHTVKHQDIVRRHPCPFQCEKLFLDRSKILPHLRKFHKMNNPDPKLRRILQFIAADQEREGDLAPNTRHEVSPGLSPPLALANPQNLLSDAELTEIVQLTTPYESINSGGGQLSLNGASSITDVPPSASSYNGYDTGSSWSSAYEIATSDLSPAINSSNSSTSSTTTIANSLPSTTTMMAKPPTSFTAMMTSRLTPSTMTMVDFPTAFTPATSASTPPLSEAHEVAELERNAVAYLKYSNSAPPVPNAYRSSMSDGAHRYSSAPQAHSGISGSSVPDQSSVNHSTQATPSESNGNHLMEAAGVVFQKLSFTVNPLYSSLQQCKQPYKHSQQYGQVDGGMNNQPSLQRPAAAPEQQVSAPPQLQQPKNSYGPRY